MPRTFYSQGPLDKEEHFFCPRDQLINQAQQHLLGPNPLKGGHYFTIWAPRQTGKTWIIQEVVEKLAHDERFKTVMISMELFRDLHEENKLLQYIVKELSIEMQLNLPRVEDWYALANIFDKQIQTKPLILMIDEIDALDPETISKMTAMFRGIYLNRKRYNLHGLALVGIRAVLGIKSSKGSPFNIQHSMHIPNLTYEEIQYLFNWYTRETGQPIQPEVMEVLYQETRGQPGLVNWLGELLTVTYNEHPHQPLKLEQWNKTYSLALQALPNNTVLNLLSKAHHPDYQSTIINLFSTGFKKRFVFDNDELNYLYLHGLIDYEAQELADKQQILYTRFSCPFIQKRLFNAFINKIEDIEEKHLVPSDDLSDAIVGDTIILKNLLRRFQSFLQKEGSRLFAHAPLRKDGRLFEAIYHFHLFHFFMQVLVPGREINIQPEFPTGNGRIDFLIYFNNNLFLLEIKSFFNLNQYREALPQTARYASQLKLSEATLCLFIEGGNQELYLKLEQEYLDPQTGVKVIPVVVPIQQTNT